MLTLRIFDKIWSVILVPDKLRCLNMLSPACNIHEPSKQQLLKRSGREGELAILEFGGHGGMSILESLGARGGVKILMPPVVGYGYFLESPIVINMVFGNLFPVNKLQEHLLMER